MTEMYPARDPQEDDRPPTRQVANECAVGLATSQGKVINAYDSEIIAVIGNTPANHSQQRVVAHWHHEAVGKGGGRSAAEYQAKMVDDCFQPLNTPTIVSKYTAIELLAEDAPTA